MKSLRHLCLSAAAAALFVTAVPAFAGTAVAKAEIPFAFQVGDRVYQPGTYVFKHQPTSNFITIQTAGGQRQIVPARVVPSAGVSKQEVQFTRTGESHRLESVVVQNHEGRRLLTLR